MCEPFVHTLRVRYHETDAQRFVFNARYLEYADVSMAEYFRDLGWSYPEMLELGFDPSVVKTEISFLRPAHLDDLLRVLVRCVKLGTTSFTLAFSFTINGTEVCRIQNIYVNVDPETETSRPVPRIIADHMNSPRTLALAGTELKVENNED